MEVAEVEAGKEALKNLTPYLFRGFFPFKVFEENLLFPTGWEAAQSEEIGMLNSSAMISERLLEQACCGQDRLFVCEGAIHHEQGLGRYAAGCSHSGNEIRVSEVKNLHQLRKSIPEDRGIDTPACSAEFVAVFCFSAGFDRVAA